jgi:hypothetical protein
MLGTKYINGRQLPEGELAIVRKQQRRARKCRDASHYDILGITKLATKKDIIKARSSITAGNVGARAFCDTSQKKGRP